MNCSTALLVSFLPSLNLFSIPLNGKLYIIIYVYSRQFSNDLLWSQLLHSINHKETAIRTTEGSLALLLELKVMQVICRLISTSFLLLSKVMNDVFKRSAVSKDNVGVTKRMIVQIRSKWVLGGWLAPHRLLSCQTIQWNAELLVMLSSQTASAMFPFSLSCCG